MLFDCKNMGLNLEYTVVEKAAIPHNYSADKFILSCVAVNGISANFIKDVSTLFASHNINIIRIDNMVPPKFECLEISTNIPQDLDFKSVKSELMKFLIFTN
jgi:hypothetical protein